MKKESFILFRFNSLQITLRQYGPHGFRTGHRVAQYKILKYTYLTFFYIFFTQFYTKIVFGAKFKFSTFTRKLLAQWPISKLCFCSNPFYNHLFVLSAAHNTIKPSLIILYTCVLDLL